MASTFTSNKVLEQPANGDYNDTWQIPVNRDWTFVDAALGQTIVFNATAGSQTLAQSTGTSISSYSYVPSFITITGAISADVTYTIPSGVGGTWVVRNLTTDATGGPWTVTFAYAGGGTSVTVERDVVETICCDTTPSVAYRGVYKPSNIPGTDSVGTATIQDGAVTYPKIATSALATVSQYRSATASTLIPSDVAWSSAGYVALTSSATITPDFSQGYNFSLTLDSVSTLANPTNVKIGQTGIIAVTEGAFSTSATITGYIGASFNGTISGTTLTASSTLGTIILGTEISGSGVTAGSTVIAYGSGSGSNGTYSLNATSTVSSSTAMTAPNTILTVTSVTGTIYVGMTLTGTGVAAGTTILSQSSGTEGGVGTYVVSTQQRVPSSGTSTTITGNIGPFFKEYGNYYVFPNGVEPTFNTTSGALNIISYTVVPGPKILLTTFSNVTGAV